MPKGIHRFIALKMPEALRLGRLQTSRALKTIDPKVSRAAAVRRTLGN